MSKNGLFALIGPVFLALTLLAACTSSPTPAAPTPPKGSPLSTSTAATPSTKAAQPAGPFSLAGKTVTLVVPYTPGGAGDITARLYAKFLPSFLPGNPSVIVRNIPGGEATIGSNFAYASKPDGLTTLLCGSSVKLAYLIGRSAAKYDLQKMDAVVAVTTGGIYFARTGTVERAEDLPKARNIIFGHTAGVTGWIFLVYAKLMDIKPQKVVLGYTGTADARRALLAGEVNMGSESGPGYWGGVDQYVQKGEIQNLFQSGIFDQKGAIVREPAMPATVPTGKELYEKAYGKQPSGPAWDAYKVLVASSGSDKVLLLPPGAPDNVLKAYWDAGQRMTKDAEFRKAADPLLGANANWMAGGDFSREFRASTGMDASVRTWLKSTLQDFGVSLE